MKEKKEKCSCGECKKWEESKEVKDTGVCQIHGIITYKDETCPDPKPIKKANEKTKTEES